MSFTLPNWLVRLWFFLKIPVMSGVVLGLLVSNIVIWKNTNRTLEELKNVQTFATGQFEDAANLMRTQHDEQTELMRCLVSLFTDDKVPTDEQVAGCEKQRESPAKNQNTSPTPPPDQPDNGVTVEPPDPPQPNMIQMILNKVLEVIQPLLKAVGIR